MPEGWQLVEAEGQRIRLRSASAQANVTMDISCCQIEIAELRLARKGETISGRTFWIARQTAGTRTSLTFLSIPFARVDLSRVANDLGLEIRLPARLRIKAECATASDCAEVRALVRSIEYDPDTTTRAVRGIENAGLIGAPLRSDGVPAGIALYNPIVGNRTSVQPGFYSKTNCSFVR